MKSLPDKIVKEVNGVIEDGAKVFVSLAKRDAPVDMGVLRNSISYAPLGKTVYEVVSGAYYSPYLEWGTITKVSVPGELQAYASQFRGKGLRVTGGIFPHPFFFKQMPIIKKQIEQDIKQVLETL